MKSIQNYYYVFINSDDNANEATNIKSLNYNLSSILNSAPNRQFIEDQAYCYVKMSYFSLDIGTDLAAIGATTTIQVRVGGCVFPNSFETQTIGDGGFNMVSSNILGLVPTGRIDATDFNALFMYSNEEYDNGYVVMSNPLKGDLNIQLTDESGTPLVDGISSGKSYTMKLEIYFPTNEELQNIANEPII
tara:strand:- start:1373 stop:1942 length:570 start_codon:yes stop_codon:yes gene_type:complete